jgi:carboxypeptidase T
MSKRAAVLLLLAAIGCSNRTSDPSGDSTSLDESQISETGPWVVRAEFTDRAQLNKLAAEHAPWEVHHKERYAIIEVQNQAELESIEAATGARLSIEKAMTLAMQAPPPSDPGISGIPGFSCYRTVEETYATAAQLATTYPTFATWTDIGNSWEKQTGVAPGYDVRVLKLTNSAIPGPKPVMFVMGAIHAREYVTAETVTRFAEFLLTNYATNPDVAWMLDHQEFHFVLQTNPDGRKRAETGSSWRKNTNQNYCGTTSSSRGADLNRNYPFLWAGGGGSSGSPCALTYRGPSAISEPETQAITAYVRSIFPDQRDESAGLNAPAPANATGIFFDLHSYSELVLWPWGFTNNATSNGTALRTLGRKLAFFNGYQPIQSIELYATDGTTIDFAYGELGVASYTIEMGTSFFQSCSTFESTVYPTNKNALFYAAKVARTPYLTPGGPEALSVAMVNPTVVRGTAARITGALNDTRFSGLNGAEPVQTIASGEVFVDVPPWAPGATPIALVATDGAFNSTIESVRADIPTGSLSIGRHTLYMRGRDAAGNVGPISAAFVTVTAGVNQAPSVSLLRPAKGTTVVAGSALTVAATASDAEQGDLSSAITWTSNLSGQVYVGGSGTVVLTGGVHTLTASVTDAQGAVGNASITVTVGGISSVPASGK